MMNNKIASILSLTESKLRQNHYNVNTIKCYSDWVFRFIFYYETFDLKNLGTNELLQFLEFLQNDCGMSPSTINQALNAILFFYREVLKINITRSSCKTISFQHNPVILNNNEIQSILARLSGDKWLMTSLMYGSGLTVSECVQLRLRDIGFSSNRIHVRNKVTNRQTLLPRLLRNYLVNQIDKVKAIYNQNRIIENYGGVAVPRSLASETMRLTNDIEYHFLFPSPNLRIDKESGKLVQYPISESSLQKAIHNAVKYLSLNPAITCSNFRHSFAANLIGNGYDIHLIQKMLGHKSIQSVMAYRNIVTTDFTRISSPVDQLGDNYLFP